MGEVYRVRDKSLRRDVAIKVLPSSLLHDAERLRRFEQEARAAAGLLNRLTKHGAIVPDRFRADLKKLAETYTSPVSIVPEV